MNNLSLLRKIRGCGKEVDACGICRGLVEKYHGMPTAARPYNSVAIRKWVELIGFLYLVHRQMINAGHHALGENINQLVLYMAGNVTGQHRPDVWNVLFDRLDKVEQECVTNQTLIHR